MKAVRLSQFGGPEVLEIVDLPDPHPGPGQVRIAVRAAGVNPSDWKKRKGLMDGELPQTMGHERPNVGIVTVRTTGFNQDGVPVITFRRTVMVYRHCQGPSIPRVAS